MNTYNITDNVHPLPDEVQLGDTIVLNGQSQEVVACQETGVKMLNIDADQLKPGDLSYIKKLGLTISNPDTTDPVALGVDYAPDTFGHKVAKFFGSDDTDEDDSDNDDDDSSFFGGFGSSDGDSSFGGGSSFGGFGGGGFSGGGASGGF